MKSICFLFKDNIKAYFVFTGVGNQHKGWKEDTSWRAWVGLVWGGLQTKSKEQGCCFHRNQREGGAGRVQRQVDWEILGGDDGVILFDIMYFSWEVVGKYSSGE